MGVALHGIMGKPADEAALGAMIAQAPSTSRCSSSFSVRRCPEPTPRRPSWPDGPCSTPQPPARWPSMSSRLSSATVVSRPTDSPRPRLPRCSTRLNRWWQIQLRQIHPHHEARIRRVDLVVAYQQKHWSKSRDQTSRMSFSNDARLINKDLGRIIAETTPSPKKKNTVCHKQVEPGSPEPAPAHLRFFIHSLILESSELIYVKLQNVLTPYDIETICGGLFN